MLFLLLFWASLPAAVPSPRLAAPTGKPWADTSRRVGGKSLLRCWVLMVASTGLQLKGLNPKTDNGCRKMSFGTQSLAFPLPPAQRGLFPDRIPKTLVVKAWDSRGQSLEDGEYGVVGADIPPA